MTTGARVQSSAGPRCWFPKTSAAAASAAPASSTSPSSPTPSARTSRPVRCSPPMSSPPRWPARAATSSRRACSRRSSPVRSSPRGPSPSPRPHDRLGDVTVTATADGDGFVLVRREGAGRSGCRVGAAARDRAHRRRSRAVPGSRRHAGVTITPLNSLDLVRRYARGRVSTACGCRRRRRSAFPGHADADVERQLQLALVIQTAEMVGAAQTVFDFTLEWMFNRYSFGRPLASYQNLKHRFADMKMWLEASHALAAAAAREVQAERPACKRRSASAKAYMRRLPRRAACRTACRCTVASASPTTTTSTSISGGSRSIGSRTAHRPITASGSPRSRAGADDRHDHAPREALR